MGFLKSKKKKNKEMVKEIAAPVEEEPAVQKIEAPVEDNGTALSTFEISKEFLTDYEPLDQDCYGKTKFEPKKAGEVEILSEKGFALAVRCINANRDQKTPPYATQFIRTCLYAKNNAFEDIIQFCAAYPEYSGLEYELIMKMKYENGFKTASALSKKASDKSIGEKNSLRIKTSVASAAVKFIKERDSFNYVASLKDDPDVKKCQLEYAVKIKQPVWDKNIPEDQAPIYALMLDSLRSMMNSANNIDSLNRLYSSSRDMLIKKYGFTGYDDATTNSYWNNLARLINNESDVVHLGTSVRDAVLMTDSECPLVVREAVSNAVDRLIVKPAEEGKLSFDEFRTKCVGAVRMTTGYACANEVDRRITTALMRTIEDRLMNIDDPAKMSEMYRRILVSRTHYADVLSLNLPEKLYADIYERVITYRVSRSKTLSESYSWFVNTVPKIDNDAMKETMAERYSAALTESATVAELVGCYTTVEDETVRNMMSETFASCFSSDIRDTGAEEFSECMEKMHGKTYDDVLLKIGYSYSGSVKVSEKILELLKKAEQSLGCTRPEEYCKAVQKQSDNLILDFTGSDRYGALFDGHRVKDRDGMIWYMRTLLASGRHTDELMAMCCHMSDSGYASDLSLVFGGEPWYGRISKDPSRMMIFDDSKIKSIQDPNLDLNERTKLLESYIDAFDTAKPELYDRKRFMDYVNASVSASYKTFGSEMPPYISISVARVMEKQGVICMDALLAYAFGLILENRYANTPDPPAEAESEHPEEYTLYQYLRSYLGWFATCSGNASKRFPLDISGPLGIASTPYRKAVVHYIRICVAQFSSNSQLVYDSTENILALTGDGPEYATIRRKAIIAYYKQRVFDRGLNNTVAYEKTADILDKLADRSLKRLLSIHAEFSKISGSDRKNDDTFDILILERSIKKYLESQDLRPEYTAGALYIEGMIQAMSMRAGAKNYFDKALEALKNCTLVWQDWPKYDPRKDGDTSDPVENTLLRAEIVRSVGICKRTAGEPYHDDMMDALELLVDCPKSERVNALKRSIEFDNKRDKNPMKGTEERSEPVVPMKTFESKSREHSGERYIFETTARFEGGHYKIHVGHRINDDGTEGMGCVMKVPKGTKFLCNATSTQDDARKMAFDMEVGCWKMLSEKCGDKVVRLLDYGDSPHPYTISQLGDKTLKEAFIDMNKKQVLSAVSNVIDAIEMIHEMGMVYNDMKPENILRVGGVWKLNDFDSVTFSGDEIHRTNLVTEFYCSPEQLKNGEVTEKTDIWSLGVVIYECIYNVLPFKNKDDIRNMRFNDSRTAGTVYDDLFKTIFTTPEERLTAAELKTRIDILKDMEM